MKNSFTDKHKELWKFIKFNIAGASSSIVELVVHMILLNFVFVSIAQVEINNSFLNFLGIQYKGYMWAYLISTTIGYAIAFVLNRKITFKADSNPTISIILYIIMVIFTIIANTWIGSLLSNIAVANNWGSSGDFFIKIIVMIIPMIWTYPCNRFIIHRHTKN